MGLIRLCAAAVFAAVTVLFLPVARSAIVNVHSKLVPEDEDGLSGEIAGALDWQTGNTRKLSLAGGLLSRMRHGRSRWDFIWNGEDTAVGGVDFDRHAMVHLRYRYDILDWLAPEVFSQYEYSDFRRLRARALMGAGPRLAFDTASGLGGAGGVSYMFEFEALDRGVDDEGRLYGDAGEQHQNHRISSYLSLHYSLPERLELLTVGYFQPRITDAADFRVLWDASASVMISHGFALKITYSVAYDNRPSESVEKLDTALKGSLGWTFGPIAP